MSRPLVTPSSCVKTLRFALQGRQTVAAHSIAPFVYALRPSSQLDAHLSKMLAAIEVAVSLDCILPLEDLRTMKGVQLGLRK